MNATVVRCLTRIPVACGKKLVWPSIEEQNSPNPKDYRRENLLYKSVATTGHLDCNHHKLNPI